MNTMKNKLEEEIFELRQSLTARDKEVEALLNKKVCFNRIHSTYMEYISGKGQPIWSKLGFRWNYFS